MYYRRVEHPTIISYWYCQQGVQSVYQFRSNQYTLMIRSGFALPV